MAEFGLTENGFIAPRADDFLTIIRDEYERLTELDVEWDDELFLGQITAAASVAFGRPAEAMQALADALDLDNAIGVYLSILCARNGTVRRRATRSTVTMQLDGEEGTIVPIDTEFRDDDDQIWVLDEDVTLDTLVSGSTYRGTGQAVSKERGAVSAAADDITEIRTPVGGLDSATNPSAATTGRPRETDPELRARYRRTIARGGQTSIAATRAALLDTLGVTDAVVLENDNDTEQVIQGITMAPHSIHVVLYPQPDVFFVSYLDRIALAIAENKGGAVKTNDREFDNTRVVEKGDEIQQTIRWAYASQVTFNPVISLELATGTTVDDVTETVEQIVSDFFANLSTGDDIISVRLVGEIEQAIDALIDIEIDFDGGGPTKRVTIEPTEIAVLGDTTVNEL